MKHALIVAGTAVLAVVLAWEVVALMAIDYAARR